MTRSPPGERGDPRLVDFARSNEALRGEMVRLRANYDALSGQLAVVLSGSETERQSRRAALNLMEDAVLARRAEQQENEVRRRVEAELREANARKDDLLATLRESQRALEAAAARQALLLNLADRIRPIAEPDGIMRVATEVLARHLGDAATHFCVVDADGETAVVAAAYTAGSLETLAEGARIRLADCPERFAPLRRGEVVRVAGDEPVDCALVGRPLGKEPRTAAAVPLMKDGRLVAVLAVTCSDGRIWTEETVRLHREVAERAWDAVERAGAIAELRESNAQRADLVAQARAAQAKAEEASRTKDEFLATLSHELRTPLAAILLWAGALRGGAVQHRGLDRAIRAIAESAESQSRLIEDLLDLSRLTAGKVRLVPAPIDVGAVVQAALEMIRPAAEAKGLTVDVSVAPLGDAWLDGGRLKQVLWNLLSNATKFTPAGGRISLGAHRQNGCLEIHVSDDGEGIAPEFMPRIFERFRQADVGETRAHAGLGIGLALSRQLLELHGGSIVAKSDGIGRGAVFRVSLPWFDPPSSAQNAPPAEASIATAAMSSLAGVSVLLVEDDAHTSAAMAQVLECAGATVRACSTAADALAGIDAMSARERRSFVVVSDLGLPGMSGFELIQRITSGDANPPVPACAISARAREVDRERVLEAGFDLYLAKPISPQQLIDAVRDLRDIGARA